jgi:hypothetical protein
MSQLVEYLISFGSMVSPSWITNVLVMLCLLAPHFTQISLKCLLLHFLELITTSRQLFLGLRCYLMKLFPHLFGSFKLFFIAMRGNHPSIIFTNQDAAMAGAITYVFPNTSHRLCLWHIYLNASKHLAM